MHGRVGTWGIESAGQESGAERGLSPKTEIRRPKETRNPKSEADYIAPIRTWDFGPPSAFGDSAFGLLSGFGIRPSDFVPLVEFARRSPTGPVTHGPHLTDLTL